MGHSSPRAPLWATGEAPASKGAGVGAGDRVRVRASKHPTPRASKHLSRHSGGRNVTLFLLTPATSAQSPYTSSRWHSLEVSSGCPCLSLHENSGLTGHQKARQELDPWEPNIRTSSNHLLQENHHRGRHPLTTGMTWLL